MTEIARFRRVRPDLLTSPVVSLEDGRFYTCDAAFDRFYTGAHRLTLQTCLARGWRQNYGLVFITAGRSASLANLPHIGQPVRCPAVSPSVLHPAGTQASRAFTFGCRAAMMIACMPPWLVPWTTIVVPSQSGRVAT